MSLREQNRALGWLVLVSDGSAEELITAVERALDMGRGPFDKRKISVAPPNIGFGLVTPDNYSPLTTWSFYHDSSSMCFIEGEFYDDYNGYRPLSGEDRRLAYMLARHYEQAKSKAIEALNGCFSGFVLDYQSCTLSTFIDRFGVRVLYSRTEGQELLVASSLLFLKQWRPLQMDPDAAFQFLTIGFPIGERTLLRNVKIQQPCTVAVHSRSSRSSMHYWRVPERAKRMTLAQGVESIVQSMEDFSERIHARLGDETVALGLSGGHDSRVILGALAYTRYPFEVVRFVASNFDDLVAERLCALMNLSLQSIHRSSWSASELRNIQDEIFLYSEGSDIDGWAFAGLGKKSAEIGLKHVLLGFSGGPVSGQLTVPEPEHFGDVRALADCALRSQMELLSFEDAKRVLNNVDTHVVEKTKSDWESSFYAEEERESLSDICIWQRLANRNFKRVRNAIMPGAKYVHLIFPYLDNVVLDAYFHLPIELIQYQRAHCHASFYRFKKLGDYPASSFPLPLKWEARFPQLMHFLRTVWYPLQKRVMRRAVITWNPVRQEYAREIRESLVFDTRQVEKLFSVGGIEPRVLNKMHVLAKFSEFYATGNQHLSYPKYATFGG